MTVYSYKYNQVIFPTINFNFCCLYQSHPGTSSTSLAAISLLLSITIISSGLIISLMSVLLMCEQASSEFVNLMYMCIMPMSV